MVTSVRLAKTCESSNELTWDSRQKDMADNGESRFEELVAQFQQGMQGREEELSRLHQLTARKDSDISSTPNGREIAIREVTSTATLGERRAVLQYLFNYHLEISQTELSRIFELPATRIVKEVKSTLRRFQLRCHDCGTLGDYPAPRPMYSYSQINHGYSQWQCTTPGCYGSLSFVAWCTYDPPPMSDRVQKFVEEIEDRIGFGKRPLTELDGTTVDKRVGKRLYLQHKEFVKELLAEVADACPLIDCAQLILWIHREYPNIEKEALAYAFYLTPEQFSRLINPNR